MSEQLNTLGFILVLWIVFQFVAKQLKLEEKGWEIGSYYALYKSTNLNNIIIRLGNWNPRFWKTLGNIGVAASFGQVAFISYILGKNIWSFLFVPEQASPVQPLIPGVTISVNSMPWFLLGAGVVILTHELGHGIMCVVEDVKVKTAALMFAVITFGGAVEPDEEDIQNASVMAKMRIYAMGSIINLITGILTIPVFIFLFPILPIQLKVFFNWLYFVAINLAMMNMLPIGPLDGGQMWRTYTENKPNGKKLQQTTTYGFIMLILMNIILSFLKFGFVQI
jgi:membrane-associated protease RseP (regulator of RpoE activity)